MWIEVGFSTGKLVALETEIDALLLMTAYNSTVRVLAGSLAAALAVRFCQVGKQVFKSRIFFEFR
jgi:hypothetical protein